MTVTLTILLGFVLLAAMFISYQLGVLHSQLGTVWSDTSRLLGRTSDIQVAIEDVESGLAALKPKPPPKIVKAKKAKKAQRGKK